MWTCTCWVEPTTSSATACPLFLPLWKENETWADFPPPSLAWTTRGERSVQMSCEHRSRVGRSLNVIDTMIFLLFSLKMCYEGEKMFVFFVCLFLSCSAVIPVISVIQYNSSCFCLLSAFPLVTASQVYILWTLNTMITARRKRGLYTFFLTLRYCQWSNFVSFFCVTFDLFLDHSDLSLWPNYLKEEKSDVNSRWTKCLKPFPDLDGFQSHPFEPLLVKWKGVGEGVHFRKWGLFILKWSGFFDNFTQQK